MKGILVLNDFPIVPPNHGGKIRIFNIYKYLSEKYRVTYLCFGNNKGVIDTRINDNFSEIKVQKDRIHRLSEQIMAKVCGISVDDFAAMFFGQYNSKMKSILRDRINDYDIVVLSLPYMFPIVKDILNDKSIVYEAQNVEYILKGSILRNNYYKNFLRDQISRIEGQLIRECNILFVTSPLDEKGFENIYNLDGKNVHLSPNGTSVKEFSGLFKNGKRSRDKIINMPLAIFVGSGHPPNIEAARIIAEEIAPRTEEVYFIICGGACWGIERDKIGKNVGLAFEVSNEEKIELYRVSNIAINPMQSGSGTNLKMLEFMAAGIPIISSPTGARGLDIEDYSHALICPVSEFPEKIRELVLNEELYNRLSDNGLKLAREKYDWEIIAENMAGVLDSL